MLSSNFLNKNLNCRGTTCPYFDDEFTADEVRAARDKEGKTYYTKAKSYSEWKKFVSNDQFTNLSNNDIIKYIKSPIEITKISGYSDEIAEGISEGIELYKKEYNINIDDNKIKIVSFGKGRENMLFRFQPMQKGNWYSANFEINKDYNFNGNIEEYQKRIMRNYNRGVLAAKSLTDLIGHEMAHFMTFAECETWESLLELESEIASKFVKGISIYADETHDGAETIVEAFIRLRNGEEVSESAKKLVEKYVERWRIK